MPEIVEVAEQIYNAYCDAVGWKSVRGDPLPQFVDQSDRLKAAWRAAANAAAKCFGVDNA